jgi:phage terminase large subunit-like protein
VDERNLKEERLLLSEELLLRKKGDPLGLWIPTPKQKPFIDSVLGNECYENWFLAANRAGKSDAGTFALASLVRKGIPGQPFRPLSAWGVSLDFPSSRDIMQPKLFDNGVQITRTVPPFIPDREIADWRSTDQILKLKNGSMIGFKSCDSGRLKFQGTDKDAILFDEEPPKDIYDECMIRLPAGSRVRILGTCTILPPEGQAGGVSWLFSEKVQPWLDGKGGHRVFTASIYDNPHLDPAAIKYLEGIYPLGSQTRRIRLDGELLPGIAGSRAYTAFDRRLHVKRLSELNPRLPLCWWWDFNVEPLMCGIGQKVGDLFRVYRVLVLEEGNDLEMVEAFRYHYPRHGGEIWVYGDATSERRTAQTGETDYQLIMKAMRTYPAPVRLKVPESNPLVRDRVNAVNYALKDEYGETHVEISDVGCDELIADLEQVLTDSRGGIKKTNDRKSPYYRRTHISDAFGYWVDYERPVNAVEVNKLSGGPRIPSPGYGFKRRA